MSLVRQAELSTPYGTHKLYSLEGNTENQVVPSQMYCLNNQRCMFMTKCCGSKSCEKYFRVSSTEELIQPSPSGNSASSFPHRDSASFQLGYGSVSSMIRSPEPGEYGEDEMKLKLQELERDLLDDNEYDEDDLFGNSRSMELDVECSDQNQNMLLLDSSKETSSANSILSSVGGSKEVLEISPRAPKRLLFDCAAMILDGNFEEATALIGELREMVSIQGDPSQRIAAYMVEGLAARMASSGRFLYNALTCKGPPSLDRLAAMQILFEICPCFRFGFMAANCAILEACKGEMRVHIIDFDINQGSQYITLIQTLADQPGKPPHLKLTGVDDPESVQRPLGGLNLIGLRLAKLAEALNVPFQFRAVPSKTSLVNPSMLDCKPGEALFVNFAFQLHHMPDESVSTVNERDQLLRMVKNLKPKLVTLVEQDVNTNTAPFLPRFGEAYDYYSAVFESLDATLLRDSQDRMNVERQCLARDIVNIIACEGEERIERYEVAGKWRARMMMAGFTPSAMSCDVVDMIRKLIQQYSDRYMLKENMGGLHFGWLDKSLIYASAWR